MAVSSRPGRAETPSRLDVVVSRDPTHPAAPAQLVVRDPDATIADLAEDLKAGRTWLAVDGRPCGPMQAIRSSGIVRGSLISTPAGIADPPEAPAHGPFLVTESGLDSARFFPLELGTSVVGRDERHRISLAVDRAASRDHCQLTVTADGSVTVMDLGSTNGTWRNDERLTGPVTLQPGDRLMIGSTITVFGVGSGVDPAVSPGVVDEFRRPPRRDIPASPPLVAVPDPPQAHEQKPALPIVALVTPIVFAVVMVLLLHSYIYAAFGLLGPLAAGGTYLDGKRRYRKAKRGETRASMAALERMGDELEAQRLAEADRLHRAAGSLGQLRRAAAGPYPTMWERRPAHPDFLEVRLANGHLPYEPVIQASSELSAAAREVIDTVAAQGVDVASIQLGQSWVGIWGDRPAALAIVRALVLQAATTSGPSDLSIRVAVGQAQERDWQWTGWLPHTADDNDGRESFPRVPPGSGGSPARTELWLTDEPLQEPDPANLAGLALASDFNRLPDRCQTVIHVENDGVLSIEHLPGHRHHDDLIGVGISSAIADAWARKLARYHDELAVGRLPDTVNGMDLWSEPSSGELRWVIGEGPLGPVEIDLSGPEPHVLIAGTSGSGRTEAVEGAVAALALRGPDTVNVAVVDLAGGRLSRVGSFPHVCGVVSDLGPPATGDGPLARLEAEVLRRDRLVRAGGFDSLEAYRAAGRPDVAHLVVAIDDPGTTRAESQTVLEAMVRLIASSAHLGVHVVLATTQPAGRAATVVKDSAARLALRLDRRSAEELVGVPYPAGLPRSRSGRGWIRIGDEVAQPVQLASSSSAAPPRSPVEVCFAHESAPSSEHLSILEAILKLSRERFPEPARPLWGGGETFESTDVEPASLAALLGVSDLSAMNVPALWAEESRLLAAPLGTDGYGNPVWLDLNEAAYGGMGPHGLIVGATGSGKSELLRTLVCALIARHPPDLLSLVLVDFKGGATFAGFSGIPHLAGLITNLESDLSNVDRMEAALLGEQQRRQELLSRAGRLGSAEAYRGVRRERPDLPPLPELLVIVDEFAELLEQRAEFISMFGSIGRLGRSLGIHLLLATQRLDEGRLRGLESHLRYRISLRTNSTTESRSVLGLPDAAMLPSEPGIGYLRVDEPRLLRFRAALVSAPPPQPRIDGTTTPDIEVLTSRVRDAAPPTHQIWLPVLPERLELGRLLGRLGPAPERGLQALDWEELGSQKTPLGVIDRPRLQSRAALVADFSGATGNLAVVGSPRSGKSSFLRTVAASLALTHTPKEIHLYGLDFAGGGLLTLSGLPHVGGVAHQGDQELVERTIVHVGRILEEREQLFRELGIHSVDQFRRRRAEGLLPAGSHGDVYLLVDGWDSLREASEVLEQRISDLARRGLAVGVHVVVSAGRWSVLRSAIRDSILGRLELRQSDPFESLFGRRAAENVPVDRPGRGITESGEHFLVALATGVGGTDAESGWTDLVDAVHAAWDGAAAPPVLRLPTDVLVRDLPPVAKGVPVGLAEPDLGALALDPRGDDQHLLVLGDSASGKTTFLRVFLDQLTAGRCADEIRVLVADPRRGLMDAVDPQLQFGYAGSVAAVGPEVTRLREALDRRLPGPEVTVAQLRSRSWWQGPEAYLVVDDHDLVVTPTVNPLLPILDLLAQASDVGFHLVLARRVAGWQRAQYEPVVQRLREVGVTTLVMSGDPAEGIITGTVRSGTRPAGRALLVRYRAAPVAVQLAR